MSAPMPNDPLNHAPDRADTALLLIDMVNALEFEGGERLFTHALPMAMRLAALKRRATAVGLPVIYANDNFGRWRSDFPSQVRDLLASEARGRPIAAQLQPADDDYFILKPKHSAFFQTNLELLLKYLGVTRLIVTGMAGDICVLFTANDAYLRDFRLCLPPDCIASEDARQNEQALALMQRVLKADLTPSFELDLTQPADGAQPKVSTHGRQQDQD